MTSHTSYDIIIIGSGIAGLYAAYNIQHISPQTNFMILDKNTKAEIGGRASSEIFSGTPVVTGAGIGRKKKDRLLYELLSELRLEVKEFNSEHHYSYIMRNHTMDMSKVWRLLLHEYNKQKIKYNGTFREFAINVLQDKHAYEDFLLTSGYTDYEKEDVYETLYKYGMDDNFKKQILFSVPWKQMAMKLAEIIGFSHFQFSNNIIQLRKLTNSASKFMVENDQGIQYFCNKLIIATTIDSLQHLLPYNPIYQDIEGQPFLRVYGKFSKRCGPILKHYIPGMIMVPGPLQKIIPINPDKLIYMIAYSDNAKALALKNNLDNTEANRNLFCRLMEKSLGIPHDSLELLSIRDFYWQIGTHYYKPLNRKLYTNREVFVKNAQHPDKDILVVGEVVSRKQGWAEGALESVQKVLTKAWITN